MTPIPTGYQLPTAQKKEYPVLPEDFYHVKITKIDLKEDQPIYNNPEETEDKLAFEYEIVEEGEFKGRKLFQDVRTIMGAGSNGFSPSWLYKIFCAVNRITLNDTEAQAVTANSINEMVGKELRLVVKQKANQSGVIKNKITDVLPVKQSALDVSLDSLRGDSGGIDPEDIPF